MALINHQTKYVKLTVTLDLLDESDEYIKVSSLKQVLEDNDIVYEIEDVI